MFSLEICSHFVVSSGTDSYGLICLHSNKKKQTKKTFYSNISLQKVSWLLLIIRTLNVFFFFYWNYVLPEKYFI